MKKIGIIAKKRDPEAVKAVADFLEWIKQQKGFQIFLESDIAGTLKVKGYSREQLPSRAEVIIVFGGDGTLLSAARLVGSKGVPILGVNLGGLGFITEISRDEILENIDKVLSEQCCFEERIMLLADVYRSGKKVEKQNALNDVVLNKSALSRMFELDININGQYVRQALLLIHCLREVRYSILPLNHFWSHLSVLTL
jgi:NAD+ kinase